ncbi:MAG: alpha-amylase [Bacteroidales bacterium]|nr:alpha-amylase [Bacteroidales bacterium]
MRRAIFPLACLLIVAAQAFSCKEKEPEIVQQTLSVSPTSLSFEPEDSRSVLLNVSSNSAWGVASSADWIKVDKGSGDGNGSVTVTVTANTGEDRSGTITIKGMSSTNVIAAADVTVQVSQRGKKIVQVVPDPDSYDGNRRASTTYQLLIYSFADSDGDGIGDFKGIQERLEYLDFLGVSAIWLSPAHPSSSYHGYDVDDYSTVNPLFGTEEDFKNLVDAAHARGIKIYMDYVLNHSGKGNAWFKEALADPSSPYRDYYFFSTNPSVDYKSFPMLKGTTYQAGEWKQATSGSPKLKISKTDEAVTKGTATWNLYMWQDGVGDKSVKFVDKGDGTYYLVMEISGKWGVLVRKYADWQAGSKFGASGNGTMTEGQNMNLVADGADMWFTGSGRYKIELSDVSTETLYYMGCFSDWMPDLNYGDVSQAENNACFQDLAASADKWINLGIDGFRLDAVKHICGGINSFSHSSNQILLKKWYDRCNATYKAAGHSDNIFMVAEEWDSHDTEKSYYKSLTSCFEFDYFGALSGALGGNASGYVSKVTSWINEHKAERSDAITSIFMTNHDQNRAAESLGKNLAKEKQAAAMMLTTPGKPFIYQGEELGYWGKKDGGDEYVRTPIMWDKAGKECAKKGVNNKVDNSMLTSSISVAAQAVDKGSLLRVYMTFSELRNTYPALANGEMTNANLSGASIASWYMTSSDGQKLLVIHNVAGSAKTTSVTDDMSKPVALLGTASYEGTNLTLGANSSVVFKLK